MPPRGHPAGVSAGPSARRWRGEGEREPVEAWDGSKRAVFVHEERGRPHLTLLHGFPTSSWDFAPLLDELDGVGHTALDHLGFGDSDKPVGAAYPFAGQLDVVEQVLERRDVDATHVVAHDYSDSIVQELMLRLREGDWTGPEVRSVTLMNGGLFYSAIDRKLVQDLLRWRIVGRLIGGLMPGFVFRRQLADVFADETRPSRARLDQHWEQVTRRGGRWAIADVADYLDERRAREDEWTKALQDPPVPVRYVWGPEDPVSGPSILEALRDRVPDPDVVELDGIGHYPQLEAPARVAKALPVGSDGLD